MSGARPRCPLTLCLHRAAPLTLSPHGVSRCACVVRACAAQTPRFRSPRPSTATGAVASSVGNDADVVEWDCAVCLSVFEDGQRLLRLPCGHVFHKVSGCRTLLRAMAAIRVCKWGYACATSRVTPPPCTCTWLARTSMRAACATPPPPPRTHAPELPATLVPAPQQLSLLQGRHRIQRPGVGHTAPWCGAPAGTGTCADAAGRPSWPPHPRVRARVRFARWCRCCCRCCQCW